MTETEVATQETAEATLPTPTEVQAEAQTEQPAPEVPEAVPEETPAETPEPQPFDPYDALEREEMKPVLEQRDKRRERELQAKLETEYAEKTKSWESTQTANTLAGYFGTLLQRVADSDAEGFDRSVSSLMSFAAPLMKDYEATVKRQASNEAAGGLMHLMGQGLKTRDRDAFDSFIERGASWPDAFKEYVRLTSAEELSKKDAEIAKLNDTIGRMKANDRTGAGPNLTQSAPGGAGINSYEEASRRYNLPMGHPEKISHERFKEERLRFGRQG